MENQIEQSSSHIEGRINSRLTKFLFLFGWSAMIVAALLYLYQSLTLASLEQRPVPFGAIVIGFFVYTVPTWLASRRNHERLFAIATLNVLLGWTLIGWLAALHWGLKEPHDSRESATVAAPRL